MSSECTECRRIKSKPPNQFMADLPLARLKVYDTLFCQVGVNYFGPLFTKVNQSEVKRYGCLFTCMTTRAIHLEIAQDLEIAQCPSLLMHSVDLWPNGAPLNMYTRIMVPT